MFQRRRARVLLAVLVVVALALVTLDVRSGEDGQLTALRGRVTAALRPLQDGVVTLVRPVTELGGTFSELVAIRQENRVLREQVAELEQRRRSLTDLERENRELRAMVELADRLELDVVGARAVALAPSGFEWTMTLDVGSRDGVEREMPVVAGAGLVGRVIQVTPTASRVLLAIDPSFTAAARSARTGAIAQIDGRAGDPMLLRPLDPEADLELGDEIVTSGYLGGVFPGGIPIGTISELGPVTARLSREVQVRPFVDFTRLHHVLVVRSAPVEDIPPLSETQDLPFTPPELPPLLERPSARVPDDPVDDPVDDPLDEDEP